MKNQYRKPLCLAVTMAAVALAQSAPVVAADDTKVEEEIVAVGSRGAPRSITDSPVPVDVFKADDLSSLGNAADLTDALKTLVPSYTATPAVGDGSAFVRPTSLRGLSSDQTLILVNGKRRHRSALIQINAPSAGEGSHSPDIGMIPGIALERVEVLRDGAAAQYGSDAIAGVINFVPKSSSEGGVVKVQYGQYYDGEDSVSIGLNKGFALGESGFLNLSLEIVDNEALSRGTQHAGAQALIDAGAQGVGEDSPFGDAPFVQTFGRPQTEASRFFFNSGADINENSQVYLQGNYAKTDGRYRFFYRTPTDGTLNDLVANDGYTGALLETGFTPFLDGGQRDFSLLGGIKGETSGELMYDVSLSIGSNELDYFLNNTVNQSIGLGGDGEPLQRGFDVGAFRQQEVNFNVDFSQSLSESLNLAYGFEWREEAFTLIAGEFNSYVGAGASGFAGFEPANSGKSDRDNWALYADLEHDISDTFFLQYAVRYEDFSDFGGTVNGKVATRWNISDAVTFRGAISTGFHAPTPGQSNLRNTNTVVSSGALTIEGLVPPTSSEALAAGGQALKEEESFSLSAGMVFQLGDATTMTVDLYKIEVDDRIFRTSNIINPFDPGSTISFYTNALDIESSGVDLVLTSGFDWGDGVSTDLSFAFNYNDISVKDVKVVQTPGGPVTPVSVDTVDDIENNFPNERFVLSGNTRFGDQWNFMVRANYFGSHFDEFLSQRTPACDVPAFPVSQNCPSAEVGEVIYVDMELGYQMSDNTRFVLGAVNIFDEVIDENPLTNAGFRFFGLPFARESAANYEGGSWYLRADYSF